MVTCHSVASGLEFGNCTHTCVTCDHDTTVLPIPVIFPRWSKWMIAENWRIAEELKDNKGFVFEVSSSFLLFFGKIIMINFFFFSVSSG